MKKSFRQFIITGWFFTFVTFINAQNKPDSIIFKALKDEIERNINELQFKNYVRPFYIGFTLQDIQINLISASFGSIISNEEKFFRSWTNRVLCGNYKINDENFYDATRVNVPSDGRLDLPIDNDYWGIRRALWLIINNTYKSAAQTYNNKIQALNEKQIQLDSLEIPDFALAPSIVFIDTISYEPFDQSKAIKFVKNLSEYFCYINGVNYNYVSLYNLKTNIYFYSTEKTKIFFPLNYILLSINVSYENPDGEEISDQLNYTVKTVKDLPDIITIKSHIDSMINILKVKANAPYIKENYIGPVLFYHHAAAQTWLQGLFGYPDNLYAYREALYNTSQKTIYYGQNQNSLESKVGKQIINKSISIIDHGKLNKNNQKNLLGYYPIDAEGVAPVDNLILVDKGVLKNLYNGRTPSRSMPHSNGHNRYILENGLPTFEKGPGVISITSTETYDEKTIREKFIELAKEQGHNYAYIVKPSVGAQVNSSLILYQYNLKTGAETIVRGGVIKPITINSFRKNIWVSNENFIYENYFNDKLLIVDGGSTLLQGNAPDGCPVTLILPNLLLIDDVEISFYNKSLINDKPIVGKPQ